ncbi:MAG TPA: hypothetical protein VKK79_13240 [Candidatus Lokiarchaeia archaeon]|nr:hypothetical protein [Candidatus Lokiarchaeia archaeon]
MGKAKGRNPPHTIETLLQQLWENDVPNAALVEEFLTALGLFHIYPLDRALMDLDPRVRHAALKKVEEYLPQLSESDEIQQLEAVHALELFFEPIRMLDEDA